MRSAFATHAAAFMLVGLLTTPITIHAQSAMAPDIIIAGMEAYADGGAEAAIATWSKGGPLEDRDKQRLKIVEVFSNLELAYGKYTGYEIIRSKSLGEKTMVVYLIVHYEKGPLFGKFIAFETEKGWILPFFDFKPTPELVLHHTMLAD